jgi:hypothetical protein
MALKYLRSKATETERTEEERDDVLATITKASVDVTDVLSELSAIIRVLAPIFSVNKICVASHRN